MNNLVPKKMFFTKGVGRHKEYLQSFEMALRDAGIAADTLQGFLARYRNTDLEVKHLYMVDESSLASTQQMRQFLQRIGPQDKVLLIGDIRQHQGVDAGKPFEQLQEAGMKTAHLN